MIGILFSIALVVLSVALIVISITFKHHLSEEIDDIKGKLEFHRRMLQYLDSCNLDHGKRLVHLEEALELKGYFDEETLNEEDETLNEEDNE